MAGQPEPISHYTDAVRVGNLLFVSGCVPVDADGRLVGGDDVVEQARQTFANVGAVLEAAGSPFRRRREGDRLPDRRRRPREDQSRAPGGVRRVASREHARRGEPARDTGCEDRGRSGCRCRRLIRSTRSSAGSTTQERRNPAHCRGRRSSSRICSTPPGSARRTARRSTRTTCPTARHPPCRRLVDAGAVVVGKANLHEFAWGVTSQNPWYGTVQEPAPPGTDDRRLERRKRRCARRRALRPRPRHRHRAARSACRPACCGTVGLKPRWGAISHGGRLPALPDARHGRPDGAHGRGRRPDVVGV